MCHYMITKGNLWKEKLQPPQAHNCAYLNIGKDIYSLQFTKFGMKLVHIMVTHDTRTTMIRHLASYQNISCCYRSSIVKWEIFLLWRWLWILSSLVCCMWWLPGCLQHLKLSLRRRIWSETWLLCSGKMVRKLFNFGSKIYIYI